MNRTLGRSELLALVAVVVVALLAFVLLTGGSSAARSARLDAAGWTSLHGMFNTSSPTGSPSSAGQCEALGAGSADVEARGVVTACLDGVAAAGWTHLTTSACGESFGDSSTPPPATLEAVLGRGDAGARARCAQDVVGIENAGANEVAWYKWFVAELAPGGCRQFFTGVASIASDLASGGERFVAAARSGASGAALVRDYQSEASGAIGLGFGFMLTTLREMPACQPQP